MKNSKSENSLSSLTDVHINRTINRSSPIDIKTSRSGIFNRNEIININLNDLNDLNDLNNLNDLNYSVYAEKKLSLSKSPDESFTNYFPKRNDKWVDSNIIHRCQICDTSFSFFTRKHHCRACGGVYCSNCCNKFMIIPAEIITKPIEKSNIQTTLTNSFRWLYGEKKDLICNVCDKKINDLKSIEYLIKIFEYLSLKDLYKMKIVCKNFNTAATHILSKFRDIQYGEHLKYYSIWEKNMIWNSKEYLLNHSIWLTILIKSTILYTVETNKTNRIKLIEMYLKNIINLKHNFENISCYSLLCSRKCTNKLEFDDIIEIFDYIKYLLKNNDIMFEYNEIKQIIIYLTKILLKSNRLYMVFPIISNILNYFFEYEDIYLDDKFTTKLFNSIFEFDNVENIIFLVTTENNFIDKLNEISKSELKFESESDNFFKFLIRFICKNYDLQLMNNIYKMNRIIMSLLNFDLNEKELPIIYPFDINYRIIKIIKTEIIDSNTKPILVEAQIINKELNKKNIKFIIKKDKNLRKEQLIACLIDIFLHKLHNLNLQIIPSYKIIMISKDVGVIEYIENSHTLRSIGTKGYTLQNYILNLNINNKLDTIKTRFVHSLSISSAIAYIIGLGDRHLDNIMINDIGQIFHIDYGYIMNNPIKLFNTPEIKLTNDIIDFLGGNNSVYYQEFKKMIVQIYNLYRANKNILYIFFKFISDSGYLDWNQISSKLDTKLMIGMKCKDVEITLINEIDSSNTITDMFTDICHNYKQKLFK